MVTVIAVIFLITAVIFALSQTLSMSGSNSIDNQQQLDSVAAMFLAESGLERAMGIVRSATSAGTMTDSVCSGINDGATYTLGRGNFKYVSAVPSPASCTGASCEACSVQVAGTVGSASRTLNLKINLTTVNGTSGVGTNVTMALKNTYDVPATAVFNLAWRRQTGGGGGNASAQMCGLASCGLQWNVESSSGSNSTGSLGVSVGIPALSTFTVTQTIDAPGRSYAEVGALFPGVSAAPTIIGSYWNDGGGGPGNQTVNNSSSTPSAGKTNSGVATSSGSCLNPSADHTTNATQTCTRWCYGGDTLVFGVSARSSTYADQITSVTFNTDGIPAQNVSLSRVAHYPNTSGRPASIGDIYSEIWYAYNPDYLSTSDASSGGSVTGSIGATFAATMTNGSSSMSVTSLSGVIHGGNIDTVTCLGGGSCPSFLTGATPVTIVSDNGGGNYTLSAPSNCSGGNCTRNLQTSSNILEVTEVSVPAAVNYLTVGDTIAGAGVTTATITSVPGGGSSNNVTGGYGIGGTAQRVSSTTITANGTTIRMTGTTIPVADTMIIAVRSGTGTFAAQTTVRSSPAPSANSFTVSAVPNVRLSGATICGGTCAFFNNPSSTSSTTELTVTRTGGTDQWAGGFTCLSGVDKSKIAPVTSSASSASTWREVVQ